MQKLFVLSIIVSLVVLWAVSCGGGAASSGSANPAGPSSTNPEPQPQPPPQPQAPPPTPVDIVGSSGSGAFNPNPVQVASGGAILWRNTTVVPHVLVMNDGTAIGTVAPGSSITSTLRGAGGAFHCVTHPSMVGSINGPSPQPPADDDDGY